MEQKNIDTILFRRIREDDRLALNTLFSKYYQKLCSFANTYVKNHPEAEEVVADVFVTIWQQRNRLDIQNIQSYLYIAVKNRALASLKKLQPAFESLEELLGDSSQAGSNDPEQAIYLRDLHDQLNLAMEAMPSRCRHVFRMSRMDALSYREISDILDISEKTVENHLIKALSIVRENFKRFERREHHALNKKLTIM